MVNNNDIFFQGEINYNDATHQYYNLEGEEYKSVSRSLNALKVPFDKQKMSTLIATRIAAEEGIPVEKAKENLLNEWDKKRDDSIDKGNYVHDSFERYTIEGTYDDKMAESVMFLQNILKDYYRFFPEIIIHSHTYRMAGRTDLALQRQKSKIPVIDFMDYKSNSEKGIQYDSIGRKAIPVRHYNKYFLPPLDHLEDCNYNLYSLQLSIYAFMAMERMKIKVGKLSILFVDNDFKPSIIPVPFMYHEAKMICEMNITRKKLPDPRHYPLTPKESFDPGKVKEEW